MKAAHDVLVRAIEHGIFPAATIDVGSSAGTLWQDAFGVPFDTMFDLASLTKPLATGSVAMRLVADRQVSLDEPLSAHFDEWKGADREFVTVRDLLEHTSGLAARLLDTPPTSSSARREFEHDICAGPLEYQPRTRSIYSDLGFILLGFLLERRAHAPLDALFSRILRGITTELLFTPGPEIRRIAAPTTALAEDLRRGETLQGVVHDNYAAALGGIAGHAGLFGTASAAAAFCGVVLRAARGDTRGPDPFTPSMVRLFTTRSTVPGSSRGLAWDTMLPTSSCGTHMSSSAFGHVGYTGTSVWIDPERDRYFVLLTNRARGGGSLEEMRVVRRAFHDALADL